MWPLRDAQQNVRKTQSQRLRGVAWEAPETKSEGTE